MKYSYIIISNNKKITSFIIAGFEGAIMKAKLEKSRYPIDAFNYYVFEVLLKYKKKFYISRRNFG